MHYSLFIRLYSVLIILIFHYPSSSIIKQQSMPSPSTPTTTITFLSAPSTPPTIYSKLDTHAVIQSQFKWSMQTSRSSICDYLRTRSHALLIVNRKGLMTSAQQSSSIYLCVCVCWWYFLMLLFKPSGNAICYYIYVFNQWSNDTCRHFN